MIIRKMQAKNKTVQHYLRWVFSFSDRYQKITILTRSPRGERAKYKFLTQVYGPPKSHEVSVLYKLSFCKIFSDKEVFVEIYQGLLPDVLI